MNILLQLLLGIGVILLVSIKLWEVYCGKRDPHKADPADQHLDPTVPSIAE